MQVLVIGERWKIEGGDERTWPCRGQGAGGERKIFPFPSQHCSQGLSLRRDPGNEVAPSPSYFLYSQSTSPLGTLLTDPPLRLPTHQDGCHNTLCSLVSACITK